MRLGRMITAGTMAMGAYRAYKTYRGGHEQPTQRSRFGRRAKGQQRRGGMMDSLLHRR